MLYDLKMEHFKVVKVNELWLHGTNLDEYSEHNLGQKKQVIT